MFLTIVWRLLAMSLLVAAVSGCSTLLKKPEKPTISLISVLPLNISMTEQKLRFNLSVNNPNNFELPVEAIDFVAKFNNTDIASGKSNQGVTIPANGEGTLTVDVTAGVSRLISTLKNMLENETLNLNYELTGNVKVENWKSPIPFDLTGAMDIPPESGT